MSTDLDKTQALTSARESRKTIREHTDKLARYVQRARANGATWEQIGDALAITKQAAQQRYGHKNRWTAADTAAGLTPSMLAKP